MLLRLKVRRFGIYFLISICAILYTIPDSVQLPFRVFLLLGVAGYYFYVNYGKVTYLQLIAIIIVVGIILYKLLVMNFDTSLLMIFLSIIPAMSMKHYSFSNNDIRLLHKWLCFFSLTIIFQLMIYRYEGRPNLSYEINQSGSYLFLFFLLCDVTNFRLGKFIVCVSAFLLLSRLLILSIILFYLIKFLQKIFLGKLINRLSYTFLILISNFVIIAFSFWFVVEFGESALRGADDISRLTNVVDGSNFVRFKINTEVVLKLLNGDNNLIFNGFGDLASNKEYLNDFGLMPHNELIKSIAQTGLLTTLFFFFLSRKVMAPLINSNTIVYFIPIVLYTLILWVRFTIVPSFEMILILFIFSLKQQFTALSK